MIDLIPAHVIERFWAKVDRTAECWIWTAARTPFGHGVFASVPGGGRLERAHRFSWRLTNGQIPEGMCVCHRCDVPACVNPAHLFLGTVLDNNADMRRKGRGSRPPQMAAHNKLALSGETLARLGREPDYVIARDVGCNKSAIARRRRALGIPPCAQSTGHDGRFRPGNFPARWLKQQRQA